MIKKLLYVFVLIGLFPLSVYAQGNNMPVWAKKGHHKGPIKPVYVVNESLKIDGIFDSLFTEPLTVKFDNDDPIPVFFTSGPENRQQTTLDVMINPGEATGCAQLGVPSDKRLLINQISGQVNLSSTSQERAVVTVDTMPDSGLGSPSTHYFHLTPVGVNIFEDRRTQTYVLNDQPNIYHDGDMGAVKVCIARGPIPNSFGRSVVGKITVSGVLKGIR